MSILSSYYDLCSSGVIAIFCQLFLAPYSKQTSYCFCWFFSKAYCQDLVTQASLWHHNGNQDVTKEAAVTMVCGHAFHNGWFEAVLWAIFYTPNLHEFNMLWGVMIEYKMIPQFRSFCCHQRSRKLTTASQVVGDTTMTSIPISNNNKYTQTALQNSCTKYLWCLSHCLRVTNDH